MLSCSLFEKLDIIGQRIRRNKKFFGGIQIVLVGDFFQLPPVDEELFLFESPIFQENMKNIIELKTIYRQKSDYDWYQILQNIRYGEINQQDIQILQSRIMVLEKPICTLFPINRKVDFMNERELLNLNSPIREFKMTIHNAEYSTPEEIEYLKTILSVPESIKLAIGSHIILTRNIDIENGLVNGSQGIIKYFSNGGHPVIKFINRKTPIEILPIEYTNEDESKIYFKQYPIKLAWALSIHKVQGHNLDCAMMDLGTNIFECGQIYVALSRIKTLKGVFLSSLDPNKIKVNPKVYNFYKTYC
jgi:ATP-dependent DNA helicase PIF1